MGDWVLRVGFIRASLNGIIGYWMCFGSRWVGGWATNERVSSIGRSCALVSVVIVDYGICGTNSVCSYSQWLLGVMDLG